MGDPPSHNGAVHDTTARVSPAVALTDNGGLGGAAGVTFADTLDDEPVPTLFFAFTVNVYAVPLVSPASVADVPVEVALFPPGDAVTV
jgi:hypothetical protein